jgi:hypothetical protein
MKKNEKCERTPKLNIFNISPVNDKMSKEDS